MTYHHTSRKRRFWPRAVVGDSEQLSLGTTRQQVLLETYAARQRAAELLKTLEQARTECEGCLKSENRQDVVKTVTGKSSIESAICQTRRMVEMLDRALAEAGNGSAEREAEVLARVGPLERVGA